MAGNETEQRALLESTIATAAFAVVAVLVGLAARSQAIVFEGMFSAIEIAMSLIALFTARLVARESDRRFQFGYWHIEPMALAFNGGALVLLCLYGFVDAVGSLLGGGHETELGWALAYAAATTTISVVMFVRLRNANRRTDSQLLGLEANAWLLSVVSSSGLLVAFGLAWAGGGTRYAGLTPYIDPIVLATLSLAFVPVPLRTLRRAVSEVLLVTPSALDNAVRSAMDRVAEQHGFLDYSSYAAKVGRGRFIEIHVLVPPEQSLGTVAQVDTVRSEIALALDAQGPDDWLTVDFTSDRRWM